MSCHELHVEADEIGPATRADGLGNPTRALHGRQQGSHLVVLAHLNAAQGHREQNH